MSPRLLSVTREARKKKLNMIRLKSDAPYILEFSLDLSVVEKICKIKF